MKSELASVEHRSYGSDTRNVFRDAPTLRHRNNRATTSTFHIGSQFVDIKRTATARAELHDFFTKIKCLNKYTNNKPCLQVMS